MEQVPQDVFEAVDGSSTRTAASRGVSQDMPRQVVSSDSSCTYNISMSTAMRSNCPLPGMVHDSKGTQQRFGLSVMFQVLGAVELLRYFSLHIRWPDSLPDLLIHVGSAMPA